MSYRTARRSAIVLLSALMTAGCVSTKLKSAAARVAGAARVYVDATAPLTTGSVAVLGQKLREVAGELAEEAGK